MRYKVLLSLLKLFMSDTTNIQELPTEGNSISKEIGSVQNTVVNQEVSLDENTIKGTFF